jgi:hypothetical protein
MKFVSPDCAGTLASPSRKAQAASSLGAHANDRGETPAKPELHSGRRFCLDFGLAFVNPKWPALLAEDSTFRNCAMNRGLPE